MSKRISILAIGLGLALLTPAAAAGSGARPAPRAHASVVGGTVAVPEQWPFMAALVQSGQADTFQAQFCGGTLIAPRAVLTAAHCVADLTPSTVQVVFGARLYPGQPREGVSDIAVHPGYDTAAFGKHDLAVLRLVRAVPHAPAPLARRGDDFDGQPASLAGFGNVQGGEANAYPDTLRQGDVVLGGGLCAGATYDARVNLCADSESPYVTSACDGDSGGPLMSLGKLVGVISYGPSRCHGESYYARVSAERAFVDAAVGGGTATLLRPIGVAEARSALPRVLHRRFGARFTYRSHYRYSCSRLSPRRVRCRVAWDTGASHYAGRVDFWTVRGTGGSRAVGSRVTIQRSRR